MNREKPLLHLPKGVEPDHGGHWAGWVKPDGSTASVTATDHEYRMGTPAHAHVLRHLGLEGDYTAARRDGHARFVSGDGWGGPTMDLQYSAHRHDAAQNVADFISAHHQPDTRVNIIRYADGPGHSMQSTEGSDKHELLGWLKERHPNITLKEDFDDIPKIGIETPKGKRPDFDHHWGGWIKPDGSTYSMTDSNHGYEAGMEAHSTLSDELGFENGYRGPLSRGYVRFVHGRMPNGQRRFLSIGYDPNHSMAAKNVAEFLDAHHKPGMEINITHMNSAGSLFGNDDHHSKSKAAAKKWLQKHHGKSVIESEFMHTPFFRAMSHVARQKVREVHARKVLNPKGAWLPHGVEPEHDGEWGGFISPNGTTYSATDRRSGYHGGNAIHADLSYELGAPPHNRMGDYTLLHDHGWVRFTRSKSMWGSKDAPNFVFNFAKQHHAAASKLVSGFLDKHHKPGVQINIARDGEYGSPYEGYDKEDAKEWMTHRGTATSESLIFRALSGESPKAIVEAIWPTLRSQMTSMKGKKVRPGVTLSQKKHTPFGFKAPTVITKRPTDVSQQPTHRRYRGQELEMQDNAGEISANVYGVHDLADLEIQRQQKGARPIVMRGE